MKFSLTSLKKPYVSNFFAILYVLVITVIIVSFLITRKEALFSYFTRVHLSYLFPVVVLGLFSLTLAALHWMYIQNKFEKPERGRASIFSWFKIFLYGYIGRYIPGKLSMIFGRLFFLQKMGVSKKSVILSSLYENLIALVSAVIIGSFFFILYTGFSPDKFFVQLGIYSFLLILFFVFISTSLFQKVAHFFLKLMKKENIFIDFLPLKYSVVSFSIYSCAAIFSGLAFYFFIVSLFPDYMSVQNIYLSIGAISLASVSGALAFVVPAGLGVREGVLVWFLQGVLPLEVAVFVSVAYRVFFMLLEVLFFTVICGLDATFSSKNKIQQS